MAPNILIVDDVAANLVALKALLKGLNREVNIVEANSGSQALEEVLEHDFALILTDVQMPEMDGFEMASILQDHDEWNQIPIIFITAAYKDEQNRDRGYEAGAVDYISKPIEENVLLSKVSIFLKLYDQRQIIQEINTGLEKRVAERTAELTKTQSLARVGGWRINPIDWAEDLSDSALGILSGDDSHREMVSLFDMMGAAKAEQHKAAIAALSDDPQGKYEFEVQVTNGVGETCNLFCLVETESRQGELTRITGVIQDVSERYRAEEVIKYLEMHDPLTSLPNRNCFQEDLHEAVADARVSGHSAAVLLFDLDKFKEINDVYGQSLADLMLADVSHSLQECLSKSEALYRIGGDEFAIIISDIDDVSEIARHAEEYLTKISGELEYLDKVVSLNCSIGISLFPQDAKGPDSLLKAADLAMLRSKNEVGSAYNFYDSEMSEAFHERKDREIRLSQAIENEEFLLYYQPKICLRRDVVVGVEALVRWKDPQRGLVPPNDFIPLAEETGQIRGIGRLIIRQACEAAARWRDEGHSLSIAVNVSVEQMKSPDLVGYLQETMEKYAVAADQIEVEITETSLLEDTEHTGATLEGIKQQGIAIALDDFGTGFSSLTHLKSLMASTVKIDRSFIQNLMTNQTDAHIADMIVAVSHKLNMIVVAEGVEEADQIARLKEMNCDIVQGYYYSKPLPEQEFLEWYDDFAS